MDRTVLITGCSSGLGEAAARLFAFRGWNVVATMRHPQTGQPLAARDHVLVTRLDIEDRTTIDEAIAKGIERFGKIDAVVNNAGYGLFSLFEPALAHRAQN
jgi:NAD(P)-dependent dehydrogenase (short-subunit alcohol dehydrogenase family)